MGELVAYFVVLRAGRGDLNFIFELLMEEPRFFPNNWTHFTKSIRCDAVCAGAR